VTVNTNPYDVLGVRPQAGEAEIHAAYVALARRYHPDLHPHDPRAGERLIALNAAYELLSDPARRAIYDRQHAAPTQTPAWERPSSPQWARTPSAQPDPEPEPFRWRIPPDETPRGSRRPLRTSPAAEKPFWRTLLTGVFMAVLVAARISAAFAVHHETAPSGCLGFATNAHGHASKRARVPCVSVDIASAQKTLPLRAALLGVSWDRGGTAGDLLHVCVGITSRASGVHLTAVGLPLRLAGPSGSAGPVASGVPGVQTGFRCGPRRNYSSWPGILQDAVFLVPLGERGHTLVIMADPPKELPLGGA
jgi:hypothetical protein